jgi:hypothetical protein
VKPSRIASALKAFRFVSLSTEMNISHISSDDEMISQSYWAAIRPVGGRKWRVRRKGAYIPKTLPV